MRVIVFAVVASWPILIASGFGPAFGFSPPAALSATMAETAPTRHVAYVCHRWWQWHGTQRCVRHTLIYTQRQRA